MLDELWIKAYIYNNASESTDPVQEYIWNYSNPVHRQHLADKSVWAWTNNHSIETEAANEAEVLEFKNRKRKAT